MAFLGMNPFVRTENEKAAGIKMSDKRDVAARKLYEYLEEKQASGAILDEQSKKELKRATKLVKFFRKNDIALGKIIVCPYCDSEDVGLLESTRKEFSAGKALIGGAVAGPAGLLVGAVGKKGKTTFLCNSCKKQFVR